MLNSQEITKFLFMDFSLISYKSRWNPRRFWWFFWTCSLKIEKWMKYEEIDHQKIYQNL